MTTDSIINWGTTVEDYYAELDAADAADAFALTLFNDDYFEAEREQEAKLEWECERSLRDAESGAAYERSLHERSCTERDSLPLHLQYLAGY